MNALDHVGADTGPDRLAHQVGIVIVGEHDDGVRPVAADHHYLFHHVATGGFGVDQHDIGARGFDPLGQVDAQAGFVHDLETGLHQGIAQTADFLRGVINQENAEHAVINSRRQREAAAVAELLAWMAKLRA
ncbi:hypothetical protein D9M71_723110 [compost metagenome]